MKKTPTSSWFWAHRRNAALHHFSFLLTGLSGKGLKPAVDFWLSNSIALGIPEKGVFIFYKKQELASQLQNIRKSIERNRSFVRDFRKATNNIFDPIFTLCNKIDSTALSHLSDKRLLFLYNKLIHAFTRAPFISVQLWGIEACIDEQSPLNRFLRDRLEQLGMSDKLQEYQGFLLTNTGETVAFTERKDFYRVASRLFQNRKIRTLFTLHNPKKIEKEFGQWKKEKILFEKHIEKYKWLNTEYVSTVWSQQKWIRLFQQSFRESKKPAEKLSVLLKEFDRAQQTRKKVLDILRPPRSIMQCIDALAEFTAQRDWTKGYFTRSLLSYHKLLDEIGARRGQSREDLLLYTYKEVLQMLVNGKILRRMELKERKEQGYVLSIEKGKLRLFSGKRNMQAFIKKEHLQEPFDHVIDVDILKGVPASPGFIRGKVRVLEDAFLVSTLQKNEILVTYMTTIEFIPAFRKAAAVITDEGGLSCHAAIISREFHLPCVVGTKIATRLLQTGDLVEVDATQGVIRILK